MWIDNLNRCFDSIGSNLSAQLGSIHSHMFEKEDASNSDEAVIKPSLPTTNSPYPPPLNIENQWSTSTAKTVMGGNDDFSHKNSKTLFNSNDLMMGSSDNNASTTIESTHCSGQTSGGNKGISDSPKTQTSLSCLSRSNCHSISDSNANSLFLNKMNSNRVGSLQGYKSATNADIHLPQKQGTAEEGSNWLRFIKDPNPVKQGLNLSKDLKQHRNFLYSEREEPTAESANRTTFYKSMRTGPIVPNSGINVDSKRHSLLDGTVLYTPLSIDDVIDSSKICKDGYKDDNFMFASQFHGIDASLAQQQRGDIVSAQTVQNAKSPVTSCHSSMICSTDSNHYTKFAEIDALSKGIDLQIPEKYQSQNEYSYSASSTVLDHLRMQFSKRIVDVEEVNSLLDAENLSLLKKNRLMEYEMQELSQKMKRTEERMMAKDERIRRLDVIVAQNNDELRHLKNCVNCTQLHALKPQLWRHKIPYLTENAETDCGSEARDLPISNNEDIPQMSNEDQQINLTEISDVISQLSSSVKELELQLLYERRRASDLEERLMAFEDATEDTCD